MAPSPHRSLRARLVLTFTLFGAMLTAAFAAVGQLDTSPLLALACVGLAGTLLGTLLGSVMARRVVRPVDELGDMVDSCGPNELAAELSTKPYDKEIGALARKLEESLRRVRSLADREQRFTRFASHELRTPVAVIKGATELIASTSAAQERDVRLPLERIQRSIRDMEGILEAFLWLARRQREHDHGEQCELVPIVDEAVSRYKHLLSGKPVELNVSADGAPSVSAPAPVVSMVVGNLVSNAFHYTNEGSVSVRLSPHSLAVTDTGEGMTVDDVDSCTDSFVRGGRSEGSGLGLSIVRTLSEQFGWRMWIDSYPGTGTAVKLYF